MTGKVEEMGQCADKCQDSADGINFATVNLLTQDECEYMLKMEQNEVTVSGNTLNVRCNQNSYLEFSFKLLGNNFKNLHATIRIIVAKILAIPIFVNMNIPRYIT